jgi:putative serine protease PepD
LAALYQAFSGNPYRGPPMRSPRHLWTGDWRAQSRAAQEEMAAARAQLRPVPDAEPVDEQDEEPEAAASGASAGSPTRRRGLLAGVVALGVLLLAGAFGLGALTEHHGGPATPSALPAVAGKPIQPRRGETRATAIYALVSPAVASIKTPQGSGTGFLIDSRGTLVTNAHVVDSFTDVSVSFGAHGSTLAGHVIGSDPSSDLAVVRVDPSQIPGGAKPLKLADSRTVQVGDNVIAIGNPFGLDRTETAGIVSAIGRDIQAPNGFQIDQAIQTDAAINPGNSGGPLLNDAGEVIGVNSQIETGGTSNGNVGIGFAVPSNSVRQVVPKLEAGQTIARPYLGVSTSSPPNGSGAIVATVVAGGPAEKAGVQVGDVIASIDGRSVSDPSQVSSIVGARRAGDTIKLQVLRGGQSLGIAVRLGLRPAHVP